MQSSYYVAGFDELLKKIKEDKLLDSEMEKYLTTVINEINSIL